ncbi:MAG: AAA family ATPase [Akkermansiaceae bacterium]
MDIDSLKVALQASPNNVPLLLLVAKAYEDEFELAEARAHYDRVLEIDPSHAQAMVAVAHLIDLDGRSSEAILRAESVVEKHPDCAEAHLLLARLLLNDNDSKKARSHYDRAVSLNAELSNDDLLEKIIRAGGSGNRTAMTADGDYIEEDDGYDDIDGLDGVAARELELEFKINTKTRFHDVGGMEKVKDDISMKIIHPLKNPDLFAAYGKKAGGGVLMYGPPGCGKTLLSRATAGEIKANFFSIGLHQVLDMYIGQSEGKLHKIFELARKYAPSVLFFDEIDALAADRRDLKGSAGRNLINQFLSELDGAEDNNDGVLILGATNAPWHLDSAFLRPGRFDRLIFVPPPDHGAREEIIRIHSKEKPVVSLDETTLAKKTDGFSGADIRAVFDHATEAKLEEAMRAGKIVPISGKDLVKASRNVKPSTRKWFESAKNYALYANQSGFYDDVLEYLGIKK